MDATQPHMLSCHSRMNAASKTIELVYRNYKTNYKTNKAHNNSMSGPVRSFVLVGGDKVRLFSGGSINK